VLATQAGDRDMGDLVIDELRKAKHWTAAKEVFAVESDPQLKANSMARRAALRFGLRCPGPEAKAFIDGVKAKEPHRVENEIDALAYEEGAPLGPADAAKKQ
jgi:hypothetical protein